MDENHSELAADIIKTAQKMAAKNLTAGHTGNISARVHGWAGGAQPISGLGDMVSHDSGVMRQNQPERSEASTDKLIDQKDSRPRGGGQGQTLDLAVSEKSGMLITPTGLPYESLSEEDIVFVSNEGEWDKEGRAPSSEWQFHLSAYQANEEVNAIVHCHSNYATTLACKGKHIPAFHYMVAATGGTDIPLVPYAIFGSSELADGVAKAFKTHKACLLAHHGQLAGEKNLAKALELAEIVEDLSQQYWAALQLGEPNLLSDGQMRAVLEKFKTYGQQKD